MENLRILGLDDDNHAPMFRMETGEIFNSLTEAALWSGMRKESASNITAQIKGQKASAGKHPVTKEPLHWKYAISEEGGDL